MSMKPKREEPSPNAVATLSFFPVRSGDGYNYGGEAIVNIAGFALIVGGGKGALELAEELATRWNDGIPKGGE